MGPNRRAQERERAAARAAAGAKRAGAENTPGRRYERDKTVAITPVEYGGLQQAYDHFNKELFGGSLSDLFITYQRRSHTRILLVGATTITTIKPCQPRRALTHASS